MRRGIESISLQEEAIREAWVRNKIKNEPKAIKEYYPTNSNPQSIISIDTSLPPGRSVSNKRWGLDLEIIPDLLQYDPKYPLGIHTVRIEKNFIGRKEQKIGKDFDTNTQEINASPSRDREKIVSRYVGYGDNLNREDFVGVTEPIADDNESKEYVLFAGRYRAAADEINSTLPQTVNRVTVLDVAIITGAHIAETNGGLFIKLDGYDWNLIEQGNIYKMIVDPKKISAIVLIDKRLIAITKDGKEDITPEGKISDFLFKGGDLVVIIDGDLNLLTQRGSDNIDKSYFQ